jgi:hypothetical protein
MTLLGVRGEGNMTVQLNATFAPFGGEMREIPAFFQAAAFLPYSTEND